VTKFKQEQLKPKASQNEVLRMQEGEFLKKYVQDNNVTAVPSSTGVYYMETKKGTQIPKKWLCFRAFYRFPAWTQ